MAPEGTDPVGTPAGSEHRDDPGGLWMGAVGEGWEEVTAHPGWVGTTCCNSLASSPVGLGSGQVQSPELGLMIAEPRDPSFIGKILEGAQLWEGTTQLLGYESSNAMVLATSNARPAYSPPQHCESPGGLE